MWKEEGGLGWDCMFPLRYFWNIWNSNKRWHFFSMLFGMFFSMWFGRISACLFYPRTFINHAYDGILIFVAALQTLGKLPPTTQRTLKSLMAPKADMSWHFNFGFFLPLQDTIIHPPHRTDLYQNNIKIFQCPVLWTFLTFYFG